jgi:predicted nucleotidyltransferase
MTDREQILHSLHEQREVLNRRYPIRRLALFRSWARGDAREDSDVDVLVDVDPSIGMGFIELAEELERALGRHVDLVSRRAIRPAYWKRIEPEAVTRRIARRHLCHRRPLMGARTGDPWQPNDAGQARCKASPAPAGSAFILS